MQFNGLSWKSTLYEYWNNLKVWVQDGKQNPLYLIFKIQSDSLLAFSSEDCVGVCMVAAQLLEYNCVI